jgi:hypothetical protein
MTEMGLHPHVPTVLSQVRPVPMQAQVVGVAGPVAYIVALQMRQVKVPPRAKRIEEAVMHWQLPAAEFHVRAVPRQLQTVELNLERA